MKKRVLFSIYSVSLILALILFLVFQTKPSSEKTTYAESVTLNCPRNFTLATNTNLQLLDGFISIFPVDCSEELKTVVTPKSSSNVGGLVVKNNIISASKEGVYTITFSIAKSKTKKLTESMTVVVNNGEESLVKLNKTDLFNDEIVDVNDLIDTEFDAELSLEVDSNKIQKEDNFLKPTAVGEAEIAVSLTKNYIKRTYFYVLNIVPANKFKISINDCYVYKNFCSVFYLVENLANSNENVDQKVVVEVLEGECEIVSTDEPLVRLKKNRADKIKLKILYAPDLSVFEIVEFEF